MGEVLNEETGELTPAPDSIEGMIAAAMSDDSEAEPEPEEAEEEEPEPEPEPEPSGLSEREMGKKFDSLGKRVVTYRGVIAQFIEDTGQPLVPCTLCHELSPGYFIHPDVNPLPEQNVQATKLLLGLPVDRPLRDDDKSNTCPKCDGWGDVKTGSKVQGKTVATCLECNGRGWIGERLNRTPAEVAAGLPEPLHLLGLPADEELLEDSWHTPKGHPDFGKLPQYRDPGWQDSLEAYKKGLPAPLPDPITVGG